MVYTRITGRAQTSWQLCGKQLGGYLHRRIKMQVKLREAEVPATSVMVSTICEDGRSVGLVVESEMPGVAKPRLATATTARVAIRFIMFFYFRWRDLSVVAFSDNSRMTYVPVRAGIQKDSFWSIKCHCHVFVEDSRFVML